MTHFHRRRNKTLTAICTECEVNVNCAQTNRSTLKLITKVDTGYMLCNVIDICTNIIAHKLSQFILYMYLLYRSQIYPIEGYLLLNRYVMYYHRHNRANKYVIVSTD